MLEFRISHAARLKSLNDTAIDKPKPNRNAAVPTRLRQGYKEAGMVLVANERLIYPRLTLMLAMCLSFIIRVRRISLHSEDRPAL